MEHHEKTVTQSGQQCETNQLADSSIQENKKGIWLYLDRLATLSILALVAVICVNIWINRSKAHRKRATVVIKIGDTLNALPGWRYEDHVQSIVVFASTDCPYCTASMDFYKKLTSSEANGSFLIAYRDNEEKVSAYLNAKGFKGHALSGIALEQYKISGFPTLILIDRHGKILQTWIGALKPDQEQEVFRRVGLL